MISNQKLSLSKISQGQILWVKNQKQLESLLSKLSTTLMLFCSMLFWKRIPSKQEKNKKRTRANISLSWTVLCKVTGFKLTMRKAETEKNLWWHSKRNATKTQVMIRTYKSFKAGCRIFGFFQVISANNHLTCCYSGHFLKNNFKTLLLWLNWSSAHGFHQLPAISKCCKLSDESTMKHQLSSYEHKLHCRKPCFTACILNKQAASLHQNNP